MVTQSGGKLSEFSYLKNIRNDYRALIVLIASWLISMTILTKCFSSLMLNTYFNQAAVPLVINLEQLLDEKNYSVSVSQINLKFLLDYKVLNQEQTSSLEHRRDEYQERIGFEFTSPMRSMSPQIFNEVIDGLAVILMNTFDLKTFESLYINQREKYSLSQHKYIYKLAVHWIRRNSLIFDSMKFALVPCYLHLT